MRDIYDWLNQWIKDRVRPILTEDDVVEICESLKESAAEDGYTVAQEHIDYAIDKCRDALRSIEGPFWVTKKRLAPYIFITKYRPVDSLFSKYKKNEILGEYATFEEAVKAVYSLYSDAVEVRDMTIHVAHCDPYAVTAFYPSKSDVISDTEEDKIISASAFWGRGFFLDDDFSDEKIKSFVVPLLKRIVLENYGKVPTNSAYDKLREYRDEMKKYNREKIELD